MQVADLEKAREAMEAREWRRAVALLSEHLKHGPGDLEGYYLRGICYGEIGKNPNLRNRIERSLQKGVADFETVLAQDSLYRDVVFQLALIRRYQNNFQKAIQLGEVQRHLRPELPHVHIGLLNFYWRYVITTPPTDARLWLRTQPGLYAQLFVGKAFEQQNLFDSAEKIYSELGDREEHAVPVLLAQARLSFSRQLPIRGTRYIKEAIAAVRTDLDALLLFDEIRTIVTPGEQAAFDRLASPAEVQRFFTEFWAKRDPMPAAPYNARLAEHYRRLHVAEVHYVFNGFRNWFRSSYTHDERYFPPTYALSHDFDDRGVMFIRHGEPDDFSISETPTWFYESSEDQKDSLLVFHFAPTCHNGVCGVTKHFVPVPRGESFLPPKLTGLDLPDAERKTQAYITQGLSTDRHRWPSGTKLLDVPFLLASFRGFDNRTLVEAYFDVPLEELVPEHDTLTFEAGLMVHDDRWQQRSFSRSIIRLPVERATSSYTGLFQTDLRPQEYHVALHVRSLDMPALRAHKLSYEPLSFAAPGLKISDILLADSVVALDNVVNREDVYTDVNPSGYFRPGAAPAVYFEIYDLALDEEGQTRYSISYTLANQQGDVTSLALGEQEGTLASPIEFVVVDVTDVSHGAYEFTVTVTDHLSGASVSRSRQLVLGR